MKAFNESIRPLFDLLGVLVIPCLAALGWFGNFALRFWRARLSGIVRHPRLSTHSATAPFWQNKEFIQAGADAALQVALLLLFTLIAWAMLPPAPGQAQHMLASSLLYPDAMAALVVLRVTGRVWQKSVKAPSARRAVAVLRGFSLAAALFSLVVALAETKLGTAAALTIQCGILLLQLLLVSFGIGSARALKAAEFPAVEIQTADGEIIRQHRYLCTTDVDYHFLDARGSELVLPIAIVQRIRTVETSPVEAPDVAAWQATPQGESLPERLAPGMKEGKLP